MILGVAVALPALLGAPVASAQTSGVNNFSFSSFDADYYLSRDTQKHSHLRVHETFVAEFPEYNQNHGIERAIPKSYDGHNLHLKIESVTNAQGKKLTYKKSTSNGNTVLRIGDANKYVHGQQSYSLTYDFKDVTKHFDDHDELFWNTNGTQWLQSFQQVTARLHIDRASAAAYDGRVRCVMGSLGATDPCATTENSQSDGSRLFTFTSGRALQYGENLSYVAGFKLGTFAAYTPSTWERIFPTLLKIWAVISGILLLGSIIFAMRIWRRYGRPIGGRGTIVPEYVPPKDMSVLISGVVIQKALPSPTAQIIDLAVRHYLKIYELPSRQFFSRKASYDIELTKDPGTLRDEEQQLLELIFNNIQLRVGQRINTKDLGSRLQRTMPAFLESMEAQAQAAGFYQDRKQEKSRYNKYGLWMLGLSIILLNPGLFLGSIIVFITTGSLKPLSEKGTAAKEYLEGLRMYIKLAEAERLRLLQSPEGAEKTPQGLDPTDTRQLVKLYERLLPFAILYGLEKQWAKQFADLYTQPPDWYAGNWSTFNAAVFASSISSFNSTSAATFAPPSSSSSSGFSGGGSGGGGGGGGGGGW